MLPLVIGYKIRPRVPGNTQRVGCCLAESAKGKGTLMLRSISILSLALFGSIGCAGLDYKTIVYEPLPVRSDGVSEAKYERLLKEARTRQEEAEKGNKGIRYYDTSPYVLFYANGKGGAEWAVHVLPDPEKLRTVRPYSKLASLETELTFDPKSGVLTKSTETADGTVLAIAVADLFAKLAPMFLALDLPTEDGKEREGNVMVIPAPRLYKIVTKNNRWYLRGGPGDEEIFLAIIPATSETKPKYKN